MIYKNLINLGIYPIDSVVKVDDTISGVSEGLNAGCWSVGLAGLSNYTDVNSMEEWDQMTEVQKEERRERSRQILFKSGAHYVADSINDLLDIVDDINMRLLTGEKP